MSLADTNEWNAMSEDYDHYFRPRFFPAHAAIVDSLVAYVNPQDVVVLDFGTGPGEPALTVAARLPECRVVGTDFSKGMIDVANSRTVESKLSNVRFLHLDAYIPDDESETEGTDSAKYDSYLPLDLLASDAGELKYDAIVSAFCFMYTPRNGLVALLRGMRERLLKPNGILIHAHWGRPSKNAFLSTAKRSIRWALNVGSEDIGDSDDGVLGTDDGSFFFSRPDMPFHSALRDAGYDVLETKSVPMPMAFANVGDVLGFAGCSFKDAGSKERAMGCAERILRGKGIVFDEHGGFNLKGEAFVVIAKASS